MHLCKKYSTVKVKITKDIKQPYAELCGPISLFGGGLQLRRTFAAVICAANDL